MALLWCLRLLLCWLARLLRWLELVGSQALRQRCWLAQQWYLAPQSVPPAPEQGRCSQAALRW